MELNISAEQSLSLSPKMLQSVEILQMGTQSLLEYINELSEENPTMDIVDMPAAPIPSQQSKLSWLSSTDTQNSVYYKSESQGNEPEAVRGESLEDYLKAQLIFLKPEPETRRSAEYIIESLDESGWLDKAFKTDGFEAAIELVQRLDPPGVGARNLKECLLLQLKRGEHGIEKEIIEKHLSDLSYGRYAKIAKALKTTQAEVELAAETIRGLNPRPGAGFASGDEPVYIIPDIFAVKNGGNIELVMNDRYLPTINISRHYSAMLMENSDPEVSGYLNNKLRQAQWVIKSIERRRTTVLECARCIIKRQESFFLGKGSLLPMTLYDIAGELGIHESTVSRAIHDKYIQTSCGVFPLSFFFSRGLGATGDVSPDKAKAAILELVGAEKKPISDSKLTELLHARGIDISRRTVAKYRSNLNLPSSFVRKK